MSNGFARLEKVPVPQGWVDEGREFTPWLAENLDRPRVALECR